MIRIILILLFLAGIVIGYTEIIMVKIYGHLFLIIGLVTIIISIIGIIFILLSLLFETNNLYKGEKIW